MKTKITLLLFSALFLAVIQGCGPGWVATTTDSSNMYQNVNYQDPPAYQQYDINSLNQYGAWVNYNSYGSVWRPRVAPDWQPFTNGHWANDGNDWVWVSHEPFGGMVYHYGSWENTPEYGWVWIPDNNVWSPACVQWAYYDDQVCWAPRRAQNRNWNDPWEQNNMHSWVAVHTEDFNRDNVGTYRMRDIPPARNDRQTVVDRREPNISVIRTRVKEPNKTYRIDRAPAQKNPVRNDVMPPVRNPQNTNPPVDRNRNDVKPPVDRNPHVVTPTDTRIPNRINPPVDNNRKNVTPPVDNNPHVVMPPVTRNPNNVRPPVNTKKNSINPPVKNNNGKVVPPRDKNKTKAIRQQKAPVKTDAKPNKVDPNTKEKVGTNDK
jgi:hypothetical protein